MRRKESSVGQESRKKKAELVWRLKRKERWIISSREENKREGILELRTLNKREPQEENIWTMVSPRQAAPISKKRAHGREWTGSEKKKRIRIRISSRRRRRQMMNMIKELKQKA